MDYQESNKSRRVLLLETKKKPTTLKSSGRIKLKEKLITYDYL